jgi:glycosyltransferase involved in cell wall biosynthesis
MALPISAFIITRNEERRLPATLAALKGLVSEIVVVDSGSTDATIEIAEAIGARVFHRDWTGYGPQKRFAEAACKHDWVINIDADEVITPGLADEICRLFEDGKPPSPSAYAVRILNIYPGDARPRALANDYNVVRFYHRSVASYSDHPVHDRVKLREGVASAQLREPIYHFPYVSLEHVIDKNNRFSTFRAATSKPRSRTALTLRLIFEFPITFIKFYFLRLHFTGGWKGFYFALCHAFMRASRIAKMLEQASEVSAETTYQDVVANRPHPRLLQNQFH